MPKPAPRSAPSGTRDARAVVRALARQGLFVTTVESCTGGALVSALTDVPGASEVIGGAWVAYGDPAKLRLGLPAAALKRHTPYSEWTARELARAGLRHDPRADFSIGITGTLSRPDPAHTQVPKGRVWLAIVPRRGSAQVRALTLRGTEDRAGAKARIVAISLKMLLSAIRSRKPIRGRASRA